eukprot:15435804-Alexandrium_andersonii.AAC.1
MTAGAPVRSQSRSHSRASQMPLSSPVLLLATTAPRYMSEALSRMTGPKSSAAGRPPEAGVPRATTTTPQPAGWLLDAT